MDISDDKRRYFIPPESMGTLFTIPLFDSSVSRKNGFFEFNLYAKKIDKDEESSNSVKLNYPLVKCSVCNIPVPKSRMKEHIRSPKHKLCLQIIEVSLDRVKYLIMAENECDKAIVPADSYFCEPCALDVENKDKINHESTNDHHRRVMHDKLLKDLLLAFKSVDYLNNLDIIKDAPEVDVLAETVQTDTVKTQAKIVSTKQDTNESSTLDMADYIDLLKNIFKSAPMPRISVDNGLVKIVALDHSEIKVPFDHFNAFFKRDGYTQCRVCLILVEDVQAHMLKTEHMKKVLLPLQNKHCIRQVDFIRKHCIICNEVFFNFNLHKTEGHHIIALRGALVEKHKLLKNKKLVSLKSKQQQVLKYCEVCCLLVDSHMFKSHCASKLHQVQAEVLARPMITKSIPDRRCDDIEDSINYNTQTNSSSYTLNYLLDKNNIDTNDLTSTNILIPTNHKVVNVDTSSLKSTKLNSFFCDLCKKHVYTTYEKHVQARKHVLRLKKKVDTDNVASHKNCERVDLDLKLAKNEIIEDSITNNFDINATIDTHDSKIKNEINENIYRLDENNLTSTNENNPTNFKPANGDTSSQPFDLTNTNSVSVEHITYKNNEHHEKGKKQDNNTSKLKSEPQDMATNSLMHTCTFCKTIIKGNTIDIMSHERTNEHKANQERITKVEVKFLLEGTADESTRRCVVCDEIVHVSNAKSHVSEDEHRQKVDERKRKLEIA